ncbi:MAG: hypothetical protein ACI8PT_003167, partial [Gammaproteobacteria bacterium]
RRCHKPPALVSSTGLFEFDDVSSEAGQLISAVWSSDNLREIDNPDPIEWSHVVAPIIS